MAESNSLNYAYIPESRAGSVELRYNGKKRLSVNIRDSSRKLPPFRLRVKNKGAYLSVHRHTFLLPIPSFFAYSGYKMMLLNDSSGRLIAVSGRGTFAELFFFIPAWKTFYYTSAFKQLE